MGSGRSSSVLLVLGWDAVNVEGNLEKPTADDEVHALGPCRADPDLPIGFDDAHNDDRAIHQFFIVKSGSDAERVQSQADRPSLAHRVSFGWPYHAMSSGPRRVTRGPGR